MASNLLRHDEYSFRVPTPPRIVVPPPSINAAMAPQFNLAPPKNHPILADMTYDTMTTSSLLDWSYERRREAQAVLPFLFLGPLNAAKDRAFLQRERITMVLGIRQKHSFESRIMNAALRVAEELGIKHATIDLAADRELVGAFPTVTRMVNDHILDVRKAQRGDEEMVAGEAQQGQQQQQQQPTQQQTQHRQAKVLIFCESGNERAAAVVAAYLMEVHEDVDYIKAMQLCQSQRFCVNFDDNIKRLLQSWWDILTARRQVGAVAGNGYAALAGPAPTRSVNKRSLDDGDDEDMDMDEDGADDDRERFERRTFAPFVDI